MATTEQKKKLLKAKIAVALQNELGRTPKIEEIENVFLLSRVMYKAVLGLLSTPATEEKWSIGHILVLSRLSLTIQYMLAILRIPMSTTTIHIKTDVETRDAARKVADQFGFTLTSLVNALLKQIARNKRLTLSLEEEPTPYLMESLKKSEEDIKAGRVISFETPDDAIAYVSSLIDDDKNHTTSAH